MNKKKNKTEKKFLSKKEKDFSRWYTDVILKAKLADYSPVKGCMVIRPYGYALWENIQKALDEMIKRGGVKNAYFPLFIPESLIKREKEHIEGFSPELAVVTIGGGEELEEKLIVRPTSETIMYKMYSKWLQSWRDLPILINQWNNIVRWEKRTYLFLRTTEFLWQEGHTVHTTHKESMSQISKALKWYMDMYQNFFAIAGIAGTKSDAEKFAGAEETFSYEMLMPDGKALQGGTSHDLGQKFAKAFNMNFQDKSGKEAIPWQTSWGLSTRSIGALIMTHGDSHGLKLPPNLAPTQIVIIPVFKSKSKNKHLMQVTRDIHKRLKQFRVEVDDRQEVSVGWKFNEWELKGVPIRIEIGEKELKTNSLSIVRRDTGENLSIKQNEAVKSISKLLEKIQKDMFTASKNFLKENTREVSKYSDFKDVMLTKKGFLKAFWCENPECETQIKAETKASTRCLELNAPTEKGKCIYCNEEAKHRWIFAQAY
jgi:prolyl-tRNA synthetase